MQIVCIQEPGGLAEPGGLREPGGLEEPGGLKEPGGLEFLFVRSCPVRVDEHISLAVTSFATPCSFEGCGDIPQDFQIQNHTAETQR